MSVVGLDIGKLNFFACYKFEKTLLKETFDNSPDGFDKFNDWINTHSINTAHFCMESTGKYGYALANFLFNHNEKVSMVNPAIIKYFSKSLMLRNKTDQIDAELIALFCEARQPVEWAPNPANIKELRALFKRVDQLTILRNQETNRLEAETNSEIISSINDIVEAIDKQIKDIDGKMKQLISSDENLAKQAELLGSIKGVGDRTIEMFLSYFSEIEKFSHPKKICAFMGINASQRQSGTSLNNSAMSKVGNPFFRKMLYMPTLCATVHNPLINKFYQRLVENGKPKKLAVCASMRKLVYTMYGVLKNDCPFDPAYSK
ncbi:MAG: IS110 family transposase [Gammaproteobacteria bacterium]|nr:IS110 family transposase [Gammaproteobacteria bacterium]